MDEIEYIPIAIENFITSMRAPIDLYLKLSEHKLILLIKQGQQPQAHQLTSYKDKKIDYLWIKKTDTPRLSKVNVTIAGVAINNKTLTNTQKARFVTAAANTMFNELEHMGFTNESFHNSKVITESAISLVEQNKSLYNLLQSLSHNNKSSVSHALAVSTVSVMIGNALKWVNKVTLEKLALGGLLHDIGLKAVPEEILKKPIAELSSDELKIYETHPYKGMEMAVSLGIVPDDVVSIIYEHHENAHGQGYPRRIRDVVMHPLARVVAISEVFCTLILPNINCPVPKSPREAILFIEHTMGQPFNKQVFKALKEVVMEQGLKSAS